MSLKEAHERACRASGMTDEEIRHDWDAFIENYEAWMEEMDARICQFCGERNDRCVCDREVDAKALGDKCIAAARDIGLMQSYAESCESQQYGCPGCPFKK